MAARKPLPPSPWPATPPSRPSWLSASALG